jgi:hypothetical protein
MRAYNALTMRNRAFVDRVGNETPVQRGCNGRPGVPVRRTIETGRVHAASTGHATPGVSGDNKAPSPEGGCYICLRSLVKPQHPHGWSPMYQGVLLAFMELCNAESFRAGVDVYQR